jgi:hypothetical protein
MQVTNGDEPECAGQWVLDALLFLSEEAIRRELHALAPILARAFDDCLIAYVQDKTAELEHQILSHYGQDAAMN